MSGLSIGDAIPAVKLLDADGAAIDLAAMRGAPLIVYFYPKADTPGCTTEAQDFTRLAPDFAHLDAQVLAVSRDAPAKLCKFRDKYGLTVRLASDEEGAVCEAFGTWVRSEEHTSELQSLMRTSYAVFCLKKKKSIVISKTRSD